MAIITKLLGDLGNHFRLIWRLMKDTRVKIIAKCFVVLIPLLYVVYPKDGICDYYPIVGFLDDLLIFGFATIIFVGIAEPSVVQEHRDIIKRSFEKEGTPLELYRHKNEGRDLGFAFGSTVVLILITGSLAGFILLGIFLLSLIYSAISISAKLKTTIEVSESQYTEIYNAYKEAQSNLPEIKTRLLVERNPTLNAYTFGFKEPYPIVLHSSLAEKMSPREFQAIIGHEMGHIIFRHTRLNSLVSTQKNFIGRLIFYKWSRTAEYSCDAIGWIASGKNARYMISALIRLTSDTMKDVDIEAYLNKRTRLDDILTAMPQFLFTHPKVHKRIVNLLRIDKKEHERK